MSQNMTATDLENARRAPQLAIDPREFELFSTEGRSAVRLYTSDHCDVLMVCWEPGQISSFHSHGPSESIVQVLRGELEVRGDGIEPMRIRGGEVVVTPTGTRHQLRNAGSDRLVTLHVYSPPMQTPMSGPIADRRETIAARFAPAADVAQR
jgi:quercetin dioxygenase-like cupin family protein